jgi:hypothetical protein
MFCYFLSRAKPGTLLVNDILMSLIMTRQQQIQERNVKFVRKHSVVSTAKWCKILFRILSTFDVIYGHIKVVPICDWMNQVELNLN